MRRAQVVAAPELREVAPARRPEPASLEYPLGLLEIEIELRHAIAEGMRLRAVPAVAHHAFVDGARRGPCRSRSRARDP